MRKAFFAMIMIGASFAGANAQTGNNQLGIGAEVGVSTQSGSKAAFGGSLKYMHGVGSAGHVTLSAGYLASSDEETVGSTKIETTASNIPVMLGYRHSFNGIYVEPQAGYVSSRVKVKSGSTSSTGTEGSFGYALGAGYAMKQGLDLGVRFFNVAEEGAKGMFIFRVGYNFTLGGASK
jgi:hypothetical protein